MAYNLIDENGAECIADMLANNQVLSSVEFKADKPGME